MKKIVSVFVLILVLCQLFVLCSCGCEHNWVEISDTGDCVKNGVKTFRCTLCGRERNENSYASGSHSFEKGGTVEPTKYNKGYTVYRCKKCGTTERRDETKSLMQAAESGLEDVIAKLKSNLIDPSSLQYDVECYSVYNDSKTGDLVNVFVYKVHYNAKNRFGGYVGYKNVYYNWDARLGVGVVREYSEYYYLNNKHSLYFSKSNTN